MAPGRRSAVSRHGFERGKFASGNANGNRLGSNRSNTPTAYRLQEICGAFRSRRNEVRKFFPGSRAASAWHQRESGSTRNDSGRQCSEETTAEEDLTRTQETSR